MNVAQTKRMSPITAVWGHLWKNVGALEEPGPEGTYACRHGGQW